jgi:hypothetical protein
LSGCNNCEKYEQHNHTNAKLHFCKTVVLK